ncbi:hypothetical protein [Peribacillus sp. YIM B13482]|uniref:hypothetical protein n=1 Tax=Peribacillus sp. YIM B13482 TaxID=3366298 RepID=UPI00366F26A8
MPSSKINPNLVFEFSVELIDGRREFIISADGNLSAFPAVKGLVKEAPKMESFKIIAYRQRGETFNIQFNDIELKPEDVFFCYKTADAETIELDLYIKGFNPDNDDWVGATFLLLDTLIGEFNVATKLSEIEFHSFEVYSNLRSITELPFLIDKMNDEVDLPI